MNLTQFKTDDLIIHRAHEQWINMCSTVGTSALSSIVFNTHEKKAVIKNITDWKDGVLKPFMLAVAILDPAHIWLKKKLRVTLTLLFLIGWKIKSASRRCTDTIDKL